MNNSTTLELLLMRLKKKCQCSKTSTTVPNTSLTVPTAEKSMSMPEKSSMKSREERTLPMRRRELLRRLSTHSTFQFQTSSKHTPMLLKPEKIKLSSSRTKLTSMLMSMTLLKAHQDSQKKTLPLLDQLMDQDQLTAQLLDQVTAHQLLDQVTDQALVDQLQPAVVQDERHNEQL